MRGGTEGGLKRVEENETGDGAESSKKAEVKMYAEKGIEGQLCFLRQELTGLKEDIPQNPYPDSIDDTVVIDEIKGTYADVSRMKAPVMVHLAQAKCYAYVYADACHLEEIGIQMTYCNMDTEEIKRFQYVCSYDELKEWFFNILGQYEK